MIPEALDKQLIFFLLFECFLLFFHFCCCCFFAWIFVVIGISMFLLGGGWVGWGCDYLVSMLHLQPDLIRECKVTFITSSHKSHVVRIPTCIILFLAS